MRPFRATVSNQIGSIRNSSSVARDANMQLRKPYERTARLIDRRLEPLMNRGIRRDEFTAQTRKEVMNLVQQVGDIVESGVNDGYDEIEDALPEISMQQVNFQKQLYKRATAGTIALTGSPTRSVVASAKREPFIAGTRLADQRKQIVAARELWLRNLINNGIRAGADYEDVRRRILGRSLNSSGLFEPITVNITTSARTAVNYVTNESKIQLAEENGIRQYRYVATLDSRTSDICAYLDGQTFDIDDPSAPQPPLHPNCRSTLIYVIDGEPTLNGERPAIGPDGVEEESARTTYSGWLREQPQSFVNDVLGPTKGRLFTSGELGLRDFVNSDYSPIPISQLEEMNREVFNRLNL